MTKTHLPLPNSAERGSRAPIDPGQSGSLGLYFDKFFNQWQPHFSKTIDAIKGKNGQPSYHTGKMSWVLSFVTQEWKHNAQFKANEPIRTRPVGCPERLRLAAKRQKALVNSQSGTDPVIYSTTSPFVTGIGLLSPLENGFLWHHTLSVPYLPGSSIKGLIRAWAEEWEEEEAKVQVARIFGRDDKHDDGPGAGCIILFDALPIAPVELMAEVITPHDGGWRIKEPTLANAPADWISPNPIPFLAVKEGTCFQFSLAPRSGAREGDVRLAYKYLERALTWLGAGAKNAIGFGRMEPDKSWKEGDSAVFDQAGGIEVEVKSVSADIIVVTKKSDGKQFKVIQFEKLLRP